MKDRAGFSLIPSILLILSTSLLLFITMFTPATFGIKSANVTADEDFGPWFAELAADLLNSADLVAGDQAYRLAEVEFYYHGPGHYDVFAHRQHIQIHRGRWYFHRTGGEYRGGSFKGLDLTLGDGIAHVGVLFRSFVEPDGAILSGPSLIVDHLLRQIGYTTVAALDEAIAGRTAWDVTSPLFLSPSGRPRTARVFDSARVGLSLKRAAGMPEAVRFVGRPYRFLTEPREISKGKPHLVLRLHERGESAEAIHRLTACPRRAIDRYICDYEDGKAEPKFDRYMGKELSTGELCRLLGAWAAKNTSDGRDSNASFHSTA